VLFDYAGSAHLAAGIETVDEVRPALMWDYFATGTRNVELAGKWARDIAELVERYSTAEESELIALIYCRSEHWSGGTSPCSMRSPHSSVPDR